MERIIIALILFWCGPFPGHASSAQTGIWSDVSDVVRTYVGDEPAARSRFSLTNDTDFDIRLNRSLRKNYHTVTVEFGERDLKAYQMSSRVERWLSEVRDRRGTDTGGQKRNGRVLVCTLNNGASLREWFVRRFVRFAKDFVTYRPSGNYDAYIMTHTDLTVDHIKFFHKRSDRARPDDDSCEPYHGNQVF